jgi:hypothetical protein
MRFFPGFFGALGALVVASLVAAGLAGFEGSFVDTIVCSVVAAAIGAGIIMINEKDTWGWGSYAIAGALSTGLVPFATVVGFCAVFASAFGRLNEMLTHPFALLPIAIPFAICGALSGIGYRYLAGVKPAAQ